MKIKTTNLILVTALAVFLGSAGITSASVAPQQNNQPIPNVPRQLSTCSLCDEGPSVYGSTQKSPIYLYQQSSYREPVVYTYVPGQTTTSQTPSTVVINQNFSQAPTATQPTTKTVAKASTQKTATPTNTSGTNNYGNQLPQNVNGNQMPQNMYPNNGNGITALSLNGSGSFMPSSIWQWLLVVLLILIIIIIARMLRKPTVHHEVHGHPAH